MASKFAIALCLILVGMGCRAEASSDAGIALLGANAAAGSAIGAASLGKEASSEVDGKFEFKPVSRTASLLYSECRLGSLEIPCFVDTGSTDSQLPFLDPSMGAEEIGSRTTAGASGSLVKCSIAKAKRFSSLGIDAAGYQFLACPSSSPEGVLGISYFAGRVFRLDFGAGLVRWNPKILGGTPMRSLARSAQGHILIPAAAGGETISGLFDTAAWRTAVDLKFVQSHPDFFEFAGAEGAPMQDSAGAIIRPGYYRAKELKMAGIDLSGEIVSAWDFGDLRNLLGKDAPVVFGLSDISKADWDFDLKENKFAVRPR